MKQNDVSYPVMPDLDELNDELLRYARLATEFGYSEEARAILSQIEETIKSGVQRFSEMVQTPLPNLMTLNRKTSPLFARSVLREYGVSRTSYPTIMASVGLALFMGEALDARSVAHWNFIAWKKWRAGRVISIKNILLQIIGAGSSVPMRRDMFLGAANSSRRRT